MDKRVPNVAEQMNRNNGGRGPAVIMCSELPLRTSWVSYVNGYSRVSLDYSHLRYAKYRFDVKPGSVNYVGTWDFHVPDWSDDLVKMTYCIRFTNEKELADGYFKGYRFDPAAALLNIPE